LGVHYFIIIFKIFDNKYLCILVPIITKVNFENLIYFLY
jgi:hypothetical protein